MENKIQLHYQDALNKFPKNRIIGVFCQGSQNYGLDDENSDLDSKCLTTPTVTDFVAGKSINKSVQTYIRPDDEHITFRDIHSYTKYLKLGSVNWVELLFAKYSVVNPNYQELWDKLIEHREEIAKYNPLSMIKSINQMVQDKYKNLCAVRTSPKQAQLYAQYQYNPKELCHLIRAYYLLENYTKWNKTFQECLLCKMDSNEETQNLKNWLIQIKRDPQYTQAEALEIGKEYATRANKLYEEYKGRIEWQENLNLKKYLKEIIEEISIKSLKFELNPNL